MTLRTLTLMLACLIQLPGLCGCSTVKPQAVTELRVITAVPPLSLYQDKPMPAPPEELTVRSLSRWTAEVMGWGNELAEDRKALRRFVETVKEGD